MKKIIHSTICLVVLLSLTGAASANTGPEASSDSTSGAILTGVFLVFGLLLTITIAAGSFVITEQNTAKIVQRLGKFHSIRHAGFSLKIPILDDVAYNLSLRLQEKKVEVETKTKDNVIVTISTSIQFQVKDNDGAIKAAAYGLTDQEGQMESFTFDIVRAEIPGMTLDEAYENKDKMGDAIRKTLCDALAEYGIDIKRVLVTDINPDDTVKEAMNRINAATRLKDAATMEGDAEKIKVIKAAEAEAESKKLQGEGIANERMAIAKGIRDSMQTLKDAGVNSEEVMHMLLLTQYFDTLRDIGADSASNVIFVPSDPKGMNDLFKQIAMGNLATKPPAVEQHDE